MTSLFSFRFGDDRPDQFRVNSATWSLKLHPLGFDKPAEGPYFLRLATRTADSSKDG